MGHLTFLLHLLKPLRAGLESALTPEQFAAAQARGKQMDFKTVASELDKELV
jgi:hypothetical protein